jgi:hypothetical protein
MKNTTYKNSCLLIGFAENTKVSDLLKEGKFSIGINSQFTDINFDLYDAMRKEVIIENNYILDYNIIKSLNHFYANMLSN